MSSPVLPLLFAPPHFLLALAMEVTPRAERKWSAKKRREHYMKHSECENQKAKEYRQNNQEKVRAYQQSYREHNRERIALASKRYRAAERDNLVEARRQRK